jgi:hypothetical protein
MIPIHLLPKGFPSSWRHRCKLNAIMVRALSSLGGSHHAVDEASHGSIASITRAHSTSPQHAVNTAFMNLDSLPTYKPKYESSPPLRPKVDVMPSLQQKWFTVDDISRVPGMGPDGAVRSLSQLNLSACTKESLLDYFSNSWALTESLLSCLKDNDSFVKSPYHELRHPMVRPE